MPPNHRRTKAPPRKKATPAPALPTAIGPVTMTITTEDRHAVSLRLTPMEHARLREELIRFERAHGMPITLGRYAKHALLNYNRLRHIEGGIAQLLLAGVEGPQGIPLIDQLRTLLDTPLAGPAPALGVQPSAVRGAQ